MADLDVVVVPLLPMRSQHQARAVLPDGSNHAQDVLLIFFNMSVRDAQVFPNADFKDFAGGGCFPCPDFFRPPGAQFASGQVYRAHPVALVRQMDESTATSQLNIVRMRSESQNVEGLIHT